MTATAQNPTVKTAPNNAALFTLIGIGIRPDATRVWANPGRTVSVAPAYTNADYAIVLSYRAPIAVLHLPSRKALALNTERYSRTTSRHQSKLRMALNRHGWDTTDTVQATGEKETLAVLP